MVSCCPRTKMPPSPWQIVCPETRYGRRGQPLNAPLSHRYFLQQVVWADNTNVAQVAVSMLEMEDATCKGLM